uniref:AAA family ATPase n=1 Tax=Fervidobacterium pennivorans TaxID=93466 RepID=A0A7C4VXC8_FERPE
MYFLSRPRRFGKSLLLSTLSFLFKGEKELFEGTWIYDKWDWQEYPVIRIDLTDVDSSDIQTLKAEINNILKNQANELGVNVEFEDILSGNFRKLINEAYRKYSKQVVVLVDEYEKPVLDNVTNKGKAEDIRKLLRSFYSVLKAQMDKIRFLLITGLTKFTKMDVFSALNNLTDISFDEKYAQMLGYTQEEVIEYFDEYIQKYLQLTGLSKEEFLEMFKEYYDGYSFDGIWYDENGKDRRVYNPHAVLLFFEKMRFAPYWSDSGAPSFVYEYLKDHNVSKDELLNQKVSESDFSQWEIEDNPPHLFLTQAGYLTQRLLTTRTSLQPIYELSIPNIDARLGIEKLLFSTEQKIDLATVSSKVNALAYAIETRDIQEMIEVIKQYLCKDKFKGKKADRKKWERRQTHAS